MKAIETKYAGCRFRSRTEARWAVVFDRLGYKWQYEPEGFEGVGWGDEPRIRYLPDFYLPEFGTWVEVKGSQKQLAADWSRMEHFLDWGSPLSGVDDAEMSRSNGLLLLGDVPRPSYRHPLFALIQHRKGLFEARAALLPDGPCNVYTEHEPPVLEYGKVPVLEPYFIGGHSAPESMAACMLTSDEVRQAYEAGRSFRAEAAGSPKHVSHYLTRAVK